MEKNAILKEAAATLRHQQVKIAELKTTVEGQASSIVELQEKLARAIYAEKIVSDQLAYDELPGDVVLKKLSEYKNKTRAQLEVLEQAVELSKNGSFLGQIVDQTETSHLDSLTAYLFGE